jgi:nucleoside-diphosphate-sugar epimerase
MQNNAAEVVVIDNLSEGYKENIAHWFNDVRFRLIEGDICNYETKKRLIFFINKTLKIEVI